MSERVRAHVARFGWNSTCFQVVNQGISHWWSKDDSILVGYVSVSGLAIVVGAPICAKEKLPQGVREWEMFAADQKLEPCYFGAEERMQSYVASEVGYVSVVLGCQPEWTPASFAQRTVSVKSLRAQVNRARNHGVTMEEWSTERAEGNPMLEAILEQWLAGRGLPTLGFLVEPHTLWNLTGRRIFVAERSGLPVAFVTLCPSPARAGWLTEQFVRSNSAPNGTVEALLELAAATVAREGSSYFTMGIVPLIVEHDTPLSDPLWIAPMRAWAKAHYRRFYNFRGLLEFKQKFRPDRWSPVVVIVKDTKFRPRHLRAIVKSFTKIEPEGALAIGVCRALLIEGRRMIRRLRLPKA